MMPASAACAQREEEHNSHCLLPRSNCFCRRVAHADALDFRLMPRLDSLSSSIAAPDTRVSHTSAAMPDILHSSPLLPSRC